MSQPQAETDYAEAMREYELAHKAWMNTSVFRDREGRLSRSAQLAQQRLDQARDTYTKAVKAAHPSWIVC